MLARCRNCRLDVRLLDMSGGFHSSHVTSTPNSRTVQLACDWASYEGDAARSACRAAVEHRRKLHLPPFHNLSFCDVESVAPRARGCQWIFHVPVSLLSDNSDTPFANARVWPSAIRNRHDHNNFVRSRRVLARNRHRSEMIKRPNIVLMR